MQPRTNEEPSTIAHNFRGFALIWVKILLQPHAAREIIVLTVEEGAVFKDKRLAMYVVACALYVPSRTNLGWPGLMCPAQCRP